eukprot:scaffold16934_cov80-Phaeocystis_antarctica.AAC.9
MACCAHLRRFGANTQRPWRKAAMDDSRGTLSWACAVGDHATCSSSCQGHGGGADGAHGS